MKTYDRDSQTGPICGRHGKKKGMKDYSELNRLRSGFLGKRNGESHVKKKGGVIAFSEGNPRIKAGKRRLEGLSGVLLREERTRSYPKGKKKIEETTNGAGAGKDLREDGILSALRGTLGGEGKTGTLGLG